MIIQPVPLTQEVKREIQPSLDTSDWTWEMVEEWLAARVACVWRMNGQAYAITAVNEDGEVDLIACGGRGAMKVAKPFFEAMLALPEHRGLILRIEGRKAWRRFCKDWECEDVGGGDVILTKRCVNGL